MTINFKSNDDLQEKNGLYVLKETGLPYTGHVIELWENDTVHSLVVYQGGKKHGFVYLFDPDGEAITRITFDNDKMVSEDIVRF